MREIGSMARQRSFEGKRTGAARAARQLLLALLACLGVLALTAGAASASVARSYEKTISEAPGGTPLGGVQAVATDSAGDLFIADGNGAIRELGPSGEFKTKFEGWEGEVAQIAVSSSDGHVYVASKEGKLSVFKPNGKGGYALLSTWTGAGAPSKEFFELSGVAVDNSASASAGDVYVSSSLGAVDIFKPKTGAGEAEEGTYVGKLEGASPKFESPGNIAVGADGSVYVIQGNQIEKFDPATHKHVKVNEALKITNFNGSRTPNKAIEELGSVAIDPVSGDVVASEAGGATVYEWSGEGPWRGWIKYAAGETPLAELVSVAASPTGHLYVGDGSSLAVQVYGLAKTVPTVSTGKVTAIERVQATLNGEANPEGIAGKAFFQYSESEEFTKATEAVSIGSGSAAEKFTQVAKGLKPGTTYFVRIVGENANGRSYGATDEFTTKPAVSALTTGPASATTTSGATLSGSLTPESLPTKYSFEYGETTAYGSSTAVQESSSATEVKAEATLTGLKPNTVYHFRLTATNSFGTTDGADETFKTAGPPVIANLATEPIGHTTATVNGTINPGEFKTGYHVEYALPAAAEKEEWTSGAEETITLAKEGAEPKGSSPVTVHLPISGLKLATTYKFRISATNTAGTVHGAVGTFTTVLIEGESALTVGAEGATFQTLINPQGTETTFHFEYGETSAYGTSIPVPDQSAGTGNTDVVQNVEVGGLKPETTYHFRVAVKVKGIEEVGYGPDRTFTTLGPAAALTLPDGRGYELVSPAEKRGGNLEPLNQIGGAIQSSESGNAFGYVVNGTIGQVEGNRSPELAQQVAVRGPKEWTTSSLIAPHEGAAGLRVGRIQEYLLFSSDLSLAISQPFPYGLTTLQEPVLAPPTSPGERGKQQKTMFLRSVPGVTPGAAEQSSYNLGVALGQQLAGEQGVASAPSYLPLVTEANALPGAQFGGSPVELHPGEFSKTNVNPALNPLLATPDLSHVVFSSTIPLAPEGTSAAGLYEWSAGKLTFVSVMPNGTPATGTSLGQIELGLGQAGQANNQRNAVSANGSRVFWGISETTVLGLGHLYVRDLVKNETLQVDTPAEGITPAEHGSSAFQIASSDGSRVFFTSQERLVPGATAAAGKPDLYECAIVEKAGKLACELSDLTIDQNAGESAGVQGTVLGASQDGRSIYFVATGVLAKGAEAGANNVYAMHEEGGKWTTALVAALSSEDYPDWKWLGSSDGIHLPTQTSRVSPNGQWLAFMSNRSLTGYDNTDVNEATGRHADEEVFLYHLGSPGSLTCVSCNPSGARPRGVYDQQFAGEGENLIVDKVGAWTRPASGPDPGQAHWLAGSIVGYSPEYQNGAIYQSSYLNDSGRLYFMSADSIVGAARESTRKETIAGKEETVGLENVYQYEPNAIGGCKLGNGCVDMLSSGKGAKESTFLDASPSGNDVFFMTAVPLVARDVDGSYDVYDARVCGEAGCQAPPPPPAENCKTIADCHGAGATPPTFGPPASATYTGPVSVSTLVVKPPPPPPPPTLTTAQKLAKALAVCHKLPQHNKKQRKKRARCEATARKTYPVTSAKARHAAKRASRRTR